MEDGRTDAIIKELTRAYWLELETTLIIWRSPSTWTASALKKLKNPWQQISKQKLHTHKNLPLA